MPDDPQELRAKLMNARKASLAKRMPQSPRVRVVPRDDDIREFIKHPNAGPFPASGSADWPLDTFTHRRLADGDITIEGNAVRSERPPARHAHQ